MERKSMEQLGILQSTAQLKACAFTGHRDLSEGISEEKLYTEQLLQLARQ